MSIELSQSALQVHFGAVCTAPILLAHCDRADPDMVLSDAESLAGEGMASEKRRAEYLLGRCALKSVLAALGHDTDTAAVRWPSPFCSLSHSHGHALAVGLAGGQGIGIDLQLQKTPPFALAERILTGATAAYWDGLPDGDKAAALQRFWTVNEAVYKACPAPQPAYFRHYRMHAPAAMDGEVSIDGTDYRFRVHTAALADGFASLALRL